MTRTVLFVISRLSRCGPVNVLKGIVQSLDPEKYRSIVATLSSETKDSCLQDFHAIGVPVRPLSFSRIGSLLSGSQRLAEFIHAVKADVVHTHGLRADILGAKCSPPCPIVSTLHSDLCRDYVLAYGRVAGRVMARSEYTALKRFDCVVAVSASAAEAALKSRIAALVIRNGIDLRAYFPPADFGEVQALRARLGWSLESFVVLHTGVLRAIKNPMGVLHGFRNSELSTRCKLVFAGDGPLLDQCRRSTRDSRNINFLGHRSDLPDLLRAADAVVSNSISEGLPMALLEACACGLRVLASDIEPHRYIAGLFPQQVGLFALEDDTALTCAFNALSQSGRVSPIQPPAGSLEIVSARRMSRLYQDVYDKTIFCGAVAMQ